MINSLSTFIKADQSDWPGMIHACLFVYITTLNRTLNEISFFLLYGREPRLDMSVHHDHREVRQIATSDFDLYTSTLLWTLRKTYKRLQEYKKNSCVLKYKAYYDKSHKQGKYSIGKRVLIYYPIAEKESLKYKLGSRWRGSYEIVSQIDHVTNRVLKEEKTIRLFPIHVLRIKRYIQFKEHQFKRSK
jgi:hypothetical protein